MNPRSTEAFEAIKDEREAEILMSALAVFARQGFAAARISQITDRAGVSHGLFYHYFDSKEAIFIELTRMAIDGSNQFVLQIANLDLPPAEKLHAMAAGVLTTLHDVDETALFFLLVLQVSVFEGVPEEAHQIARSQTTPIEATMQIVKTGQADGTIREGDPLQMTIAFWAAVQGLAVQQLVSDGPLAIDPAILTRIFLP